MRKTILNTVSVKGVGLHTGAPSTMTFKPAEDGIHFVRVDIAGSEPIKADLDHVGSTLRGTNLKNETAEVWTVEHVLSTLRTVPSRLLQTALPKSMRSIYKRSAFAHWRAICRN